jgi:SAM-dependent methyltransferase
MKQVRKKFDGALNIPTLRLEGSLLLPDMLEKIALGKATLQSEADYLVPKGLKLKDEYSRAFQIGCAQWAHFAMQMSRGDLDPRQATNQFVAELLRDVFGYSSLTTSNDIAVGERQYAINHLAEGANGEAFAVVIAPHTLTLDDADTQFALHNVDGSLSGARKKSAFQLTQEFLNAGQTTLTHHHWALVCNGKTLRLLRNAATLTRPSFIEIDLQELFSGQRFFEFSCVWHLLHASRAGLRGQVVAWEEWRNVGINEGTRIRAGLRDGVTSALYSLGNGFLRHPSNAKVREALQNGSLTKEAYFAQLLRLIYRFIFVFSIEERGLLQRSILSTNMTDADELKALRQAESAYHQGYAFERFKRLSLRRRARNQFDDLWQSVRIVFKGLASGQERLALPALGGLFASHQCPDLDSALLTNADLLAAVKSLRWANPYGGGLAAIDYRNMGVEELGSVYESLLELVPEIDLPARQFGFVGMVGDALGQAKVAGSDRKLTGSYYTPDSLVQELIKSALDPVIDQRLSSATNNPIDALLAIKVVDPACGSGHFLLAAARRLAERLAQLRSADGAVTPRGYRHALREVIAKCIFGVDRNPMAIELARMALWLEGFEEGRPLSFLDHHLQCGDALLGLVDLKALSLGIPNDAYKALSGDDKETCKALVQANGKGLKQIREQQNSQQLELRLAEHSDLQALTNVESMASESPADVALKEAAYKTFLEQSKNKPIANAADILVAAYLIPKTAATSSLVPTSATVYLELMTQNHNQAHQAQVQAANRACQIAQVFHWPLAFPQVFAAGGFDCVLGNPPWERIKLQEEEYFATRHPAIAQSKNKAERDRRITWLSQGLLAQNLDSSLATSGEKIAPSDDELRLFEAFIAARREAEAASVFAHVKGEAGGRYPLTGVGDVNTYALFAETILQITTGLKSDASPFANGRAGFIVPTGIATDDSTKAYFGHISQTGRLVSLYDIENREAVFPSVHRSYKFCLLTLGSAEFAEFVCFATQTNQLSDSRRRFKLTPAEFKLINPNTLTCPMFRSERDAEITKKLYRAAPVLIDENKPDGNPWGISFMTMFHMSNDSHLFLETPAADALPLYEAKLIHQYDHRWATYTPEGNTRDMTLAEKQDPNSKVVPRYWIPKAEVEARLASKG